eukprot:3247-Heterococcus_DN1.PRE.1
MKKNQPPTTVARLLTTARTPPPTTTAAFFVGLRRNVDYPHLDVLCRSIVTRTFISEAITADSKLYAGF